MFPLVLGLLVTGLLERPGCLFDCQLVTRLLTAFASIVVFALAVSRLLVHLGPSLGWTALACCGLLELAHP